MEFKKLNLTDMDALTDIFGEAQHIFFDPSQPDHHAWAKDMAARQIGRGTMFWAGLIAGEPIGLVGLLHDKQPNGKNREFAEITNIGVKKNIRGKGYGSSLLTYAESVARSRGVLFLELETTVTTAPFYEKNGYTIDVKFRGENSALLYKDLRKS